jgi:hypothetical protein
MITGIGKECMMLARIISLAALAAVASTPLKSNAAEAGLRICLPFLLCPHPPARDEGDYASKYEGEAPAPKKKTAKAVSATKPSLPAAEKKAVNSTAKKTASAAPSISCEKGEEIVSGYGFANVTPSTCIGQIFAFNATRTGKAYVIKLSSASGELTEVNKVQ